MGWGGAQAQRDQRVSRFEGLEVGWRAASGENRAGAPAGPRKRPPLGLRHTVGKSGSAQVVTHVDFLGVVSAPRPLHRLAQLATVLEERQRPRQPRADGLYKGHTQREGEGRSEEACARVGWGAGHWGSDPPPLGLGHS